MAKRTAVIDIGSSSIRLVIYEKSSRFAFHLLHEAKSRVRLSHDSYQNDGNLQKEPIERTLLALTEFQSIIKSYKVQKTLCVATSAVRDAPNKKEFIKKILEKTGISIKVIDGEKEAKLGGIACANLLSKTSGLTIDIGGGSTECSIIDGGTVLKSMSLNIGTIRLKELFCDDKNIEEATQYIDHAIEELPQEALQNVKNIIGIGGTFRAVSQALLEQSEHSLNILHGFEYSSKKLKHFLKNILEATEKELKELGIKKERFDIIKPGALIILRILKYTEINHIISSGVGVREGVYLHDLLRNTKDQFPHNYDTSVQNLIDRFMMHPAHASQRQEVSMKIISLLQNDFNVSSINLRALKVAAKLSSIGKSINFYSYHHHSQLLIDNGLTYGFSHKEIILISTLVRFHKRKRTSKEHLDIHHDILPIRDELRTMSFSIALSEILLQHFPRNIDFKISYKNKMLTISGKNLYLAQEKAKNLEIPHDIELVFNS
jgi:exopolyphosphatase/guanosine-5'-triphosphate,3'-diphosphate pyrophosphatase